MEPGSQSSPQEDESLADDPAQGGGKHRTTNGSASILSTLSNSLRFAVRRSRRRKSAPGAWWARPPSSRRRRIAERVHPDSVTSAGNASTKQAGSGSSSPTPLGHTSPPLQPSTSEVTRDPGSAEKNSVSPPGNTPAAIPDIDPSEQMADDGTPQEEMQTEPDAPFSFRTGASIDDLPVPDAPRKAAPTRSRLADALRREREVKDTAAAPVAAETPAAASAAGLPATSDPHPHPGRPAATITRASRLRFTAVASSAASEGASTGTSFVQVASAISLENALLGELRIPAHGTTGPKRAADGDEVYCVQRGLLEVDVDWVRATLREGDWIHVPYSASYEFRNKFNVAAQLAFFTTTNPSSIDA